MASETCTATYTTTQADVDHGSLSNTGTATGTPPKGEPVTDTSSLCIPADQTPSISVVKTANVTSFSAPGTLITYSYKVTNTGNVTLDPVVVSDPMTGLSDLSCPHTSLGPLATETCTATYTTTQGDVDHGSLCNTGTATGTPPKGEPVTDTSSLCIPAEQSPSISVVKTANVTSFSAPGTLITYSYKVTNTGNVTLNPVVVSDPMTGLSDLSCPHTSLGPLATETCTATYTTTQGDVDHGSLCNTGTATGTPPKGEPVTDTSSLCIPAEQSPSISVVKTANVTSFSAPGTLITYSYKVTNTGNVTLNPVVVSDPMTGLSDLSCPHTSLGPLASETCTATYTTTQGDVDHGSLCNTGTATGTPPKGEPVTDTSSLCIPAEQSPSISVVKTANVTSFSAPGTLITYSYKVTNTGNVTLDPVVVSDPMTGLSDLSCPHTSLGPLATETCTATYTTTQGDVDHGSLCNTGTATGTPPKGEPVTDTSSLCIPAEQSPSISVVKTANVTSFSAPGTLITYSYKVTNTGNVTLNPVVVSDPMTGLSDLSCPHTSLGPLASETCTATYTTTQGDVDHGSLCNTGTATGTPPKGEPVTDTSSLCIPAEQSPSISVVKTASVTTVSAVNQVVTYTFTITNTGNVTLHSVGVTDAQMAPSLDSSLGPIVCTPPNGSITLAPGETDTCTATYTVTQADLTNGHVDDTATASGIPPNSETPVTDTSSLSLTVTSVTVVKAVSPSSVVAGSTTPIVYTITVKNTGTATTTAPIIVTDAAPSNANLDTTTAPTCQGGPPACLTPVVSSSGTITWTIPPGVAPGTSYTLTYQVIAKSTDAAGDTISNTASWSGPSCGSPVVTQPVTTTAVTTCNTNTVTTTVTAPPPVPTPPVATMTTTFTPPPVQQSPPLPAAIAFTGAFLPQEWTVGAAALWLGAGLVVLARWRRRRTTSAAK